MTSVFVHMKHVPLSVCLNNIMNGLGITVSATSSYYVTIKTHEVSNVLRH